MISPLNSISVYTGFSNQISQLVSTDEAEYECHGIVVNMVKEQPAFWSQNATVHQNSRVTCIDRIVSRGLLLINEFRAS